MFTSITSSTGSRTRAEAALMSIDAGMDLEAPDAHCYMHQPQLVREGRVSEQVIDRSVARVLRTKFRAGLFDGAHRAVTIEELDRHLHTPEMVALARRVAEESVILLKNDDGLLVASRETKPTAPLASSPPSARDTTEAIFRFPDPRRIWSRRSVPPEDRSCS